jgi:glutamate decarboxylase
LLLDDFKGAVAHLGEHPVTVPMSKEEPTEFNHLQNRSQGLTSDRSK